MIIRDDLPDHKIVVGCIRDSQIHVEMAAFQILANGTQDKCLTLAEAKFMAACDVGGAWAQFVRARPIFGFDENGSPCFVKDGVAKPKAEPVIEPPLEGVLECAATQDDCIGQEVH